MRMYTMAKNVVTPAMISMRMVEPAAVMPKNLSSPAAFLELVTVNSSLIRFFPYGESLRETTEALYHTLPEKAMGFPSSPRSGNQACMTCLQQRIIAPR